MIVDQSSTGTRLAVGATVEAAARSFGAGHQDVLLMSYDDVAARPELPTPSSIGVVVAPGCEHAFGVLVALDGSGGRPDVEVVVDVADHALLRRLLEAHALGIGEVHSRSGGVVLGLTRGPDAARDRLLQAIAAASTLTSPRSAPSGNADRSAPRRTRRRDSPPATPPRPTPPLVRILGRMDRLTGDRRRVLAAGAAVGLVLLTLVAFALAGSTPVAVLLDVALGTAAVLTALAGLAVVLLLARQVHRQTARIEEAVAHHETVLRRHEQRLTERETVSKRRTALTHDFLESIATAQALQSREVQVALQDLRREQ